MSVEWQALPNLRAVSNAQHGEWEIECRTLAAPDWKPWDGHVWKSFMDFRGRPEQPKTKTVKLVAYIMANGIFRWVEEGSMAHKDVVATKLRRVPAEDKTVEVEE